MNRINSRNLSVKQILTYHSFVGWQFMKCEKTFVLEIEITCMHVIVTLLIIIIAAAFQWFKNPRKRVWLEIFLCILIVEYRRYNSPLAFLKYEIATFYFILTINCLISLRCSFIHFGQLPVDPSAERLLLVRSIFFTYPHLTIVIDGSH